MLWGSDPDAGNDDCHTGDEFDTLEEALKVFENPTEHGGTYFRRCAGERSTVFIEIDGPDIYKKRRLRPDYIRVDDDEWRREIAMQAGMGMGVQAYNDAMGYGYEPD